jgi:hypothetical protein
MSYETLVEGYRRLYERLFSDAGIAGRIRNKMRFMPSPVYHGEYPFPVQLGIFARLLVRGVIRGGIARIVHFLRTVPWLAPRKLPLVVVDWIAGLAMRDYIERHFTLEGVRDSAAVRFVGAVRRAVRLYVRTGDVACVLNRSGAAPSLTVTIKGFVDRDFFRGIARPLERLLGSRTSTLMLHIEELREATLPELHRLLERLRRHGDRVFIFVAEKLRGAIQIDSSVFNLVFEPAGVASR